MCGALGASSQDKLMATWFGDVTARAFEVDRPQLVRR